MNLQKMYGFNLARQELDDAIARLPRWNAAKPVAGT